MDVELVLEKEDETMMEQENDEIETDGNNQSENKDKTKDDTESSTDSKDANIDEKTKDTTKNSPISFSIESIIRKEESIEKETTKQPNVAAMFKQQQFLQQLHFYFNHFNKSYRLHYDNSQKKINSLLNHQACSQTEKFSSESFFQNTLKHLQPPLFTQHFYTTNSQDSSPVSTNLMQSSPEDNSVDMDKKDDPMKKCDDEKADETSREEGNKSDKHDIHAFKLYNKFQKNFYSHKKEFANFLENNKQTPKNDQGLESLKKFTENSFNANFKNQSNLVYPFSRKTQSSSNVETSSGVYRDNNDKFSLDYNLQKNLNNYKNNNHTSNQQLKNSSFNNEKTVCVAECEKLLKTITAMVPTMKKKSNQNERYSTKSNYGNLDSFNEMSSISANFPFYECKNQKISNEENIGTEKFTKGTLQIYTKKLLHF